MNSARLRASIALLSTLALLACGGDGSGPGNGGGGGGSLTATASAPSTGNGDITAAVTVVDTVPLAQGDAQILLLTGTVNGIPVKVEVYVLLADGSIPLLEHVWGADLNNPDGFSICSSTGGYTTCDPSKYTATIGEAMVVFNGLVLGPALGDGDTSTLTGTIDF